MGFLPKNKMTVESFILSIFRIWSEKSNCIILDTREDYWAENTRGKG